MSLNEKYYNVLYLFSKGFKNCSSITKLSDYSFSLTNDTNCTTSKWKSLKYKTFHVDSDTTNSGLKLPFGIISEPYCGGSSETWRLDFMINDQKNGPFAASIVFTMALNNDEYNGSKSLPTGHLNFRSIRISSYQSPVGHIIEPKFNTSHDFYLIGHRGFGVTPEVFKKEVSSQSVPYPENTIASFKRALDCGIKMVEIDVHYTSDHQIILHHDFHLPNGGPAIIDLTLKQVNDIAVGEQVRHDHSLYPTLEEVFKSVDERLGFNIELKYPVTSEDQPDRSYPLSKNFFIDKLLKLIDKLGGTRVIFLSCFNPDICLMLKLKQKRFPVIQITRGGIVESDNFLDQRILILKDAFVWTKSVGLDGIVSRAAFWKDNADIAEACKQQNILAFAYDSFTDTLEFKEFAKKHSIRGLIVDSIENFDLSPL